jgi:hypothetical protein
LRFEQVLESGPASELDGEAPVVDLDLDLDLVVVSTSDPGRAPGLFGARLGLEMVLDRRSDAVPR